MSSATYASLDRDQDHRTVAETSERRGANPVRFFEQNAKSVWLMDLPSDEKASRLRSVSESVYRYITRARAQLAKQDSGADAWRNMACDRAMAYLELLAADMDKLAATCDSVSAK